MPEDGLGEQLALERLVPTLLYGAAELGADTAFAHMDPPTPWITWAVALCNAAKNQNLLHPSTAPQAREIERRVIHWLAPCFGMQGGHMTPGASLANLTALWAAREVRGIKRVIASRATHVSIRKAANVLALDYRDIPTDAAGRLERDALPADLGSSVVVLTAGTTGTGAIDALTAIPNAGWVHVDAAWAGPLRLSERYRSRLDGIDVADSVAVSAHKWLFQPKEAALVFFQDEAEAHAAMSFGGSYLAAPNIGLQGSHGAMAAPLLATLLAWGRRGVAEMIHHNMSNAEQLAAYVRQSRELELWRPPVSGIVNWRPVNIAGTERFLHALPEGSTSSTLIDGERWLRNVAANPNIVMQNLFDAIDRARRSLA